MKYQYEIPVLDGGLSTKNNPSSLPPNASPDLLNVIFDDFGAVGTRNGSKIFNTAAIATGIIDGLISFKKNNKTSYLVAACQGTVWYASGTSFVSIPSSQGIFTAGVDINFINYNNNLLCCNGNVRPYKWDGTYFTHFGPSAPTGAVSASLVISSLTGLLSGNYQYVTTAVNSALSESDYGTPSTVRIASGQQLVVHDIPVYPSSAGVNQINIYRNTALTSGVFYLVTAVVNGTTACIDNTPDSSLVAGAPLDNGVLSACKYFTQYQGRLFAAGNTNYPMRLYFTEPGAEIIPSTNFINIEQGDGYPISGLAMLGNSILIHKNDGNGNGYIYLLYIPDSTGTTGVDNWYLIKSPSTYSGQSHKALVYFENQLAFLNNKGVFGTTGKDLAISAADSKEGTFQSDSKSFSIEPTIFNLNNTYIPGSAGIMFKNKLWFSVPYGVNIGYNNAVLQYDYMRISNSDRNTGAWSLFNDLTINNFTVHNGNLYGGSSLQNGYVYQLDTLHNDVSSAINSYFITAGISGIPEHKDNVKVFRYLWLWVELYGKWNLSVDWIIDYKPQYSNAILIDLSSGGSVWDAGEYDNSTWGGGLLRKKVKVGLNGVIGRDIQFRFRINEKDHYWKVHKVQVFYSLRSLR